MDEKIDTSRVDDHFRLEKQAMRGDPMPDGLPYPDQWLYQALAWLYARYRLKAIGRDDAKAEKRKLLREYETHCYRHGLADHWAERRKRTELARAEYRKDRTIENANALLKSIDGMD